MATYDLSPLMNGVNNAFNNVIKAKMYSNEMDRKLANDAYNRRYTDARIALTNAQRQGAQQKADMQNQIFSMLDPKNLNSEASMLAMNLAGVNNGDVQRGLTLSSTRPYDVEYKKNLARKVLADAANSERKATMPAQSRGNGSSANKGLGGVYKAIKPADLYTKYVINEDTGKPERTIDGDRFVRDLSELIEADIPFDTDMRPLALKAGGKSVDEIRQILGIVSKQLATNPSTANAVANAVANAGVSIPDVSNGVRALFGNNVPAETGAIDSNSVVTNKNSDGRKSSTSTNSQPIIQTREQIIDLYRKGQISRDEAERMANSAGIPW